MGQKIIKDLTGQTFGDWTVLHETIRARNGCYQWMCKCSCGVEKPVIQSNLLLGLSKRCKICHAGRVYYLEGEILNWIFSKTRAGAKRRNIIFDITRKYAFDVLNKQKFKCALSGIEITLPKYVRDKYTSSIDRIDSIEGYVIDNIQ